MAQFEPDPYVTALTEGADIVVFDGVCVLCSGFLRFMLRHDHHQQFKFVTAQSDLGEALYEHLGLKSADYDTNVVIVGGHIFTKLDAFAAAMGALGGIWRAAKVVRVLPYPIADWLYNRIARNRYSVFGRTESCMIPTPDIQDRFLA
ncbi:thiol-disulfide oxidoreductase DCC family protein [Litoreibacter janthinus]|uniref:Predicted thiol-disulfide oxidoreductase YuxK, DCC family n=1 Tax=Litoreibacter janthinus TaxID=670154 RepID=A0A1I6HND8_9RHOB|nr:DCC1-like thiol-disulfide oxidoreductase family protein [Litoreibacter janthinus]SFR55981.1 Predicted thiol-disulfide oxidoreductase YuxK, DCC family [Litoreibacter janthinus]